MKEMFMSFFRGFWDALTPINRDFAEGCGLFVGTALLTIIVCVVSAFFLKLFLTLFA